MPGSVQILLLPVFDTAVDDAAVILATANKLRDIRLLTLYTNPEQYGSVYHEELQRPVEFWVGRLSNPDVRHWIAIDEGNCTEEDGAEAAPYTRAKWVGLTRINKEFDPEEALGRPVFTITGVFVHPEYRQLGIAAKLMRLAMQHFRDEPPPAVCRLSVMAHNVTAKAFYERLGLTVVRKRSCKVWRWKEGGHDELQAGEGEVYRLELYTP